MEENQEMWDKDDNSYTELFIFKGNKKHEPINFHCSTMKVCKYYLRFMARGTETDVKPPAH
jgi:hypothetical protein